MRILIVSYELWDGVTNGGNVLSSLFEGYDAELAQIFCVGGTPYNRACKRYFQLTDQMVIHRQKMGRELIFENYPADTEGANPRGDVRKTVTHFRSSLMLLREMAWWSAKWKTKELEKFVLDFKPDLIFAPCNPIPHVLKIQRYVKEIAKCPMVSYVYDDIYTLKKFYLSPIFWLNHFYARHHVKRVFKAYDFVFTMTDKQKREYEKRCDCPMEVLTKGAQPLRDVGEIDTPVKLIYAGGVYINRWRILRDVKKALAQINRNGKRAELHIYTANKVNKKQQMAMADGENSFLHPAVGTEELKELYKSSHIALHVESFRLRSRLDTRLSFSTKITDCLSSGCATVAIGPLKQAGVEYLKERDAAVTIGSRNKIKAELERLILNSDLIKEYTLKGLALCKEEHSYEKIGQKLDKCFKNLVEAKK